MLWRMWIYVSFTFILNSKQKFLAIFLKVYNLFLFFDEIWFEEKELFNQNIILRTFFQKIYMAALFTEIYV